MPTLDRKPRRRKHSQSIGLTNEELLKALKAAVGDTEAWEALRPVAIKTWSHLKPEQALAIFDVYGRRPCLMPNLPPNRVII